MSDEAYHCKICDRGFSKKQSYRGHFTRHDHEPPWQDESTLRELYVKQGKSTLEVAEELDCSPNTVKKWMDRNDIETRDISDAVPSGEEHVFFREHPNTPEELQNEEWLRQKYHGQEKMTTEIATELDCSRTAVIDWIDRHGIDKRTSEETSRLKSEKMVERRTPDELRNREFLYRLYVEENLTTTEIANRIGCTDSTVGRWLKQHDIDITDDYDYPTGEDHHMYSGGRVDDYGTNWESIASDIRERDEYTCQRCGMSQENHIDKYDCRLSVHHIIPRSEFKDEQGNMNFSKANDPNNLISLCVSCHRILEGIPIDVR